MTQELALSGTYGINHPLLQELLRVTRRGISLPNRTGFGSGSFQQNRRSS